MLVFSVSYLSNNYKIMLNGIWLERFVVFKIVRFEIWLWIVRGHEGRAV